MKLPTNSMYILALVAGQRQWIIAHVYKFTSATGLTDYFTDFDTDIAYAGNDYKSGGLRIDGLRMKIAVGISVDEQDCTIWASPTDTLFGAAFLTGMAEGLMDGGTIQRTRIVWVPTTGNVAADILAPPIAAWPMFLGYMSKIEKLGRASVQFKVKSPLVKLNIDMPRNFYQPSCLWSLFDDSVTTHVAGVGCTLLASSYAVTGTVGASPTQKVIPVAGGVATRTGGDGLPNYQRGRIIFSSGVNDGLMATLDTNDANNVYLAYPLNAACSPGDTFTIYPGCQKSFNTCGTKFGNTANFRGFDVVPPVMVSL
jgi:uncharacterized phage protein (TIGR02218 family)